eukprot:Platyproteum_vivax@DN2850_c0_g1_i1.p1
MIYYKRILGGINLLFMAHGSILLRVLPKVLISALLTTFVKVFGWIPSYVAGGNMMWHPYPIQIFILVLSYITVMHMNMAYQRFWEARTALQSMASKWCDCVSQAVAFDHPAEAQGIEGGAAFRAQVLHLFSLLHASVTSYLHHSPVECTVIGELTNEELAQLDVPVERPYMVFHWINVLLINRRTAGGLCAAPPIVSRMFHELSDGMLYFNQACKIDDTPFPFPYIQLLQLCNWCLTFFAPIVLSCFVKNLGLAISLTVLGVGGYWAMHEAAADMESPFGGRSNDLPLPELHDDFLKRVQVFLTPDVVEILMPEDTADRDLTIFTQPSILKPTSDNTPWYRRNPSNLSPRTTAYSPPPPPISKPPPKNTKIKKRLSSIGKRSSVYTKAALSVDVRRLERISSPRPNEESKDN